MIRTILSTTVQWLTIGYAVDYLWSILKKMNQESPGETLVNALFERKKKKYESPIILPADD